MVFCLEMHILTTRVNFKLRLTHYSNGLHITILLTKQEFDGDFTEEGDTHGFELALDSNSNPKASYECLVDVKYTIRIVKQYTLRF